MSGANTELTFALYQTRFCPYCFFVRQALDKMALDIEARDISVNQEFREELMAGGGKTQVPCLRIQQPDGEVQWLYESQDIIQYLQDYESSHSHTA